MMIRSTKVFLLAAVFITAEISSAAPPATNHIAIHHQIHQTGARLLELPASQITLSELQTLVVQAQKYFSARKQIEEPLFRQRLQDIQNFRYSEDSKSGKTPGQLPSVSETLIAAFQQYLSAHPTNHASNGVANDIAQLTQLRDLLRQVEAMNEGHLSGSTWLYDSPLPSFAAEHLKPLDQQIIQTSLASGVALRKKHQYAQAIKIYKTLLTDYANSSHGASIKVLLDAAIVEDYKYQAKLALNKHDYTTARAALRKIIALYPDSDYAEAAQKALDATVPDAIKFYKNQGEKYFQPEGHVGVAQKEALENFQKMYEEDKTGPLAGYAVYYWARSLGTEGKIKEALNLLQGFDKRFSRSKQRPDALFLQGFLLASSGINQNAKAAEAMEEFARRYPQHKQAKDALWYATFFHAYDNQFKEALTCLQQFKKYSKDKRQQYVAQWESTFRHKIQTGGKWP